MSGFFNIRAWVGVLLFACGIMPAVAANPFQTIPWNGYSGAASFTFDDGVFQVEHLPQMLEEMPEVKVTFFLSNMGADILNLYGAEFANLARQGHEIGNHSNNHKHLTSLSENNLRKEVIDFADEIQQVLNSYGADVNITSNALPFSANSEQVSKVVNERHFINRSSWGNGRHNWDEEPRWTDMDSRAWYSWPNAEEDLLKALDTAAYIGDFTSSNPWYNPVKSPAWVVLLNHGVSYMGENHITPEAMRNAFKHAVENNMWIAPFSTVGAYYRAHFTLDAAQAVAEGNDKYTVTWEMPHKDMPKSIPMKVKLTPQFIEETFGQDDSIVLEQDGNTIYPDENGVFTIEFASQQVTIRKASKSANMKPYSVLSIKKQVSLAPNENITYTLMDMKGNRLGETNGFEVPAHLPKGAYIIRAAAPGFAPVTRKVFR